MQTIQLILIPLFVADTEEANFFCYAGMAKVPCHGMIIFLLKISNHAFFQPFSRWDTMLKMYWAADVPTAPFPAQKADVDL